MDVSVIFATYNREDVLEATFDRWREIRNNTKYEFEIICSDDESTDRTVEIIKEAQKDLPIKLIQNPKGGAGRARNAALKIARGKIIIFTGDDIFPNVDFVNQHYENYLKYGDSIATLGRIDWHSDIKMNHLMKHITEIGCEQFGFVALPVNQVIDFRHFYTSNISVSRKLLDDVGVLFRSEFDKYGFEDIELGYRLQKAGMKIYYDPTVLAEHHHIYDSVEKFCNRQKTAGEEMVVFGDLHEDLYDKCFYDIDNCRRSFAIFLSHKKINWSATGEISFKVIGMSRLITRELEKRLQKKETLGMQKLCSMFYFAIFQFYFAYGLTERIASGQGLRSNVIAEFAVKYRLKPYAQIYQDVGDGFNEIDSRKWVIWKDDFQILKYDLDEKTTNVRISPMKNRCIAWVKGIYFINECGEREVLEPTWHNARRKRGIMYDFRNTNDPCIIFEDLQGRYTNLVVEMKVIDKKSFDVLNKIKHLVGIAYQKIIQRRKNQGKDVIEFSYGQPRKVQIGIDTTKGRYNDDLIDRYRKICCIFGDAVVISSIQHMKKGYTNYIYSPNKKALSENSMLQVVYTLLDQAYDYIRINSTIGTDDCKNEKILRDTVVFSELLCGDLIYDKMKYATGKIMNIPECLPQHFQGMKDEKDDNGKVIMNNKTPIYHLTRRQYATTFEKKVVFIVRESATSVTPKLINRLNKLQDKIMFCFLELNDMNETTVDDYVNLKKLCEYSFCVSQITGRSNFSKVIYELMQVFQPNSVWVLSDSEKSQFGTLYEDKEVVYWK